MKQTCIFLFIILMVATGCASIPPKQPSPVHKPAEREGTTLRIDVSHVEGRIGFLENMLKNKDLTHEERKTVLALLDAYGLLKKTAAGPITGKESDLLTQSLFQSMSRHRSHQEHKNGGSR